MAPLGPLTKSFAAGSQKLLQAFRVLETSFPKSGIELPMMNNKFIKNVVLCLGLFLGFQMVAAPAFAEKIYLNYLFSHFPEAKVSNRCNTCHKSGKALNDFGYDFFEVIVRGKDPHDPDNWLKLTLMDSDGDGINNGDELAMDLKPGKAE